MKVGDMIIRFEGRLLKIEKMMYIILGALAVQMGKDFLPTVTALLG